MPSLKHLKSFNKFKQRTSYIFQSGSEKLTNHFEKLLLVCHEYKKVKPIILSKGIATMLPASLILDDDSTYEKQPQFRPCLGSRKLKTNNEQSKKIKYIFNTMNIKLKKKNMCVCFFFQKKKKLKNRTDNKL